MVGKSTRRSFHLLVGATLIIATSVVGGFLTSSLPGEQSLWSRLGWVAVGIGVTFFYLRWQLRSQEESPEAIKERVSQLERELRSQVQIRSYGARSKLVEAPLKELDLDIEPRVGWVRDPRLVEPETTSEKLAGIVAAFDSSERRLLIVGEPGSGKTMAAYSLIEHLDKTEGDERVPLLVNVSAWEDQDSFEAFLVDYLCSPVGYEVRERVVADEFIRPRRCSLILDGLDEIPAGLRTHFSEHLNEFIRGLPGEVGVVVTCRTQEYEELLAAYPTGLGLIQAVEILPLSEQQLDSAFVELTKRDKEWETFLSQRHLRAYQRVRSLLRTPLFLNLAVVGRLTPHELLDRTTTEQELQDLVLVRYLDRTLADQSQAHHRQYEPEDARCYLSWIARFLNVNGAEVSPFGLKTSDYTVFDLADLTPPFTPGRYQYFVALVGGLVGVLFWWLVMGLGWRLLFGLFFGLILALPSGGTALSSHLIFMWPSTREQFRALLRKLVGGLVWPLLITLVIGPVSVLFFGVPFVELFYWGLGAGLVLVVMHLYPELFVFEHQSSTLIASRTPKDARSRSLVSWLFAGLVVGLFGVLISWVSLGLGLGLLWGLGLGLLWGLLYTLDQGGWFVLLQKIAHHRLNQDGKLPSNPYDFLEWGIDRQIFRRVGGGVRFRHNLIQQHLASTSE